jgi:cbb3-type cytochrome oxidase maturation protein
MNGLALLIPAALLLGLGGLAAFFWSLRAGQYDDLDGAALRILNDDSDPVAPDEKDQSLF